MMLTFWFLFYVTAAVESKCAQGYYYDGLLENCHHCSLRCSSPPNSCATYCRSSSSSGEEPGQSLSVWIILIVLSLTLVACIVLTLILQVIRQKACRMILKAKEAQDQKTCASDGSSKSTEQSDDVDGSLDIEGGQCQAPYSSSLPLPSTEEGVTVLVTTKTVQSCNL